MIKLQCDTLWLNNAEPPARARQEADCVRLLPRSAAQLKYPFARVIVIIREKCEKQPNLRVRTKFNVTFEPRAIKPIRQSGNHLQRSGYSILQDLF
jgi:hypothetical protein